MSGFERRMLKNPCFFLTIFRLLVWKVISWPHPVAMLGDTYDLGIGIYGSSLKKMNLMRSISFLLFFFVSGPWSFAQSSNPVADACMTNGLIWAMVRDGNTLYLVGRVYPNMRSGPQSTGGRGCLDRTADNLESECR